MEKYTKELRSQLLKNILVFILIRIFCLKSIYYYAGVNGFILLNYYII